MKRTLDLRVSQQALDALTRLQRHHGLGKSGSLVELLVDRGVLPEHVFFLRPRAEERMRATVDGRLADDMMVVARADGVSLEQWVEALVRTADKEVHGHVGTAEKALAQGGGRVLLEDRALRPCPVRRGPVRKAWNGWS